MPIPVSETFLSIGVKDMKRATAFYVGVFGATVRFATDAWTSLFIAGVRLGLALAEDHAGGDTGLHFAVSDLATAGAEVERAGGRVVKASVEVAPGVFVSAITDTEGNGVTLTRSR